ncbi:MAG: ceramidase domain-containing protein [Alphaproteobacteria bacterium]|nr:ceramidase domain-containing protein [Alphaproteobacteria bacterium]
MDLLEKWARWLDGLVPRGHWHDKIYSYCERGGDGSFWAEPFNAWSNGAFHLAALAALVLWFVVPAQRRSYFDLVLILLVFIIGTGSFLFHTLATRWAAIADVAPITTFMLVYVAYALKRFVGAGWIITIIGVVLFFFALREAAGMRSEFGNSVAYVPALGALLLVGAVLGFMRHPAWPYVFCGGLIFAVSLALRTYDKAWCDRTEFFDFGHVGTHLWWHILNALLLYLLLQAAILHGRGRAKRTIA